MLLITGSGTAEVLQPSEQPLNFPSVLVAPQLGAVGIERYTKAHKLRFLIKSLTNRGRGGANAVCFSLRETIALLTLKFALFLFGVDFTAALHPTEAKCKKDALWQGALNNFIIFLQGGDFAGDVVAERDGLTHGCVGAVGHHPAFDFG